MSSINIPPVNRPISLVAVCIIAVVVLGGLYVWITGELPLLLLVVLIVLVLLLLVGGIWLTIKYPQIQMTDEPLRKYVVHERRAFGGFEADTAQTDTHASTSTEDAAQGELNTQRIKLYEDNRGLFLVHTWRFSTVPGQVADIIISLQEHPYYVHRSILEEEVESVRYELGRRFFDEPQARHNREDNFALEVSAYSPMLCLAEVKCNDGHEPIYLSRYIDFPTDVSPP